MLFKEKVVTFLSPQRGTSGKAERQLIDQNKNKLNFNEIQKCRLRRMPVFKGA